MLIGTCTLSQEQRLQTSSILGRMWRNGKNNMFVTVNLQTLDLFIPYTVWSNENQ